MSSVLTSDIFFFVTTIAVLAISACIIIISVYVIRILKDIKNVSGKASDLSSNLNSNITSFINYIPSFFNFSKKTPRKPTKKVLICYNKTLLAIRKDLTHKVMVNNTTKNKGGMEGKVAIGVGIGMLAALSAGAYYLYGTKDGAKKRVKIRGWILKAKGEVMEKLETLKEVNEETYNAVVSNVMKKYQSIKSIDPKEVDALMTDLKKHWKNIKKHLSEKPTKSVPKTRKVKVA